MGFFGNLFGGASNNENLSTIVKDDAFLVDVRTAAEFAEGRAPGSVNIPLDQIGAKLNQFKNKKNIVVFCRSGARSSQAKAILERNGFTNVTNGGTWQNVNQALK